MELGTVSHPDVFHIGSSRRLLPLLVCVAPRVPQPGARGSGGQPPPVVPAQQASSRSPAAAGEEQGTRRAARGGRRERRTGLPTRSATRVEMTLGRRDGKYFYATKQISQIVTSACTEMRYGKKPLYLLLMSFMCGRSCCYPAPLLKRQATPLNPGRLDRAAHWVCASRIESL